jgi:hypothetical protein
MPAVIAGLSARREPRTSSNMQWRASTTFTLAPSINPSARSRQASLSPQLSDTTVAEMPAAQSPKRQATGADDVLGNDSTTGRERAGTDRLVENDSQVDFLSIHPLPGVCQSLSVNSDQFALDSSVSPGFAEQRASARPAEHPPPERSCGAPGVRQRRQTGGPRRVCRHEAGMYRLSPLAPFGVFGRGLSRLPQ